MRFGKRMFQGAIPEWRKKYIPYKKLKKQIKLIKDKMTNSTRVDESIVQEIQRFWYEIDHAFDTISVFYCKKVKEFQKTLESLTQQLYALGLIPRGISSRRSQSIELVREQSYQVIHESIKWDTVKTQTSQMAQQVAKISATVMQEKISKNEEKNEENEDSDIDEKRQLLNENDSPQHKRYKKLKNEETRQLLFSDHSEDNDHSSGNEKDITNTDHIGEIDMSDPSHNNLVIRSKFNKPSSKIGRYSFDAKLGRDSLQYTTDDQLPFMFPSDVNSVPISPNLTKEKRDKAIKILKNNFSEFYLSLIMLQRYCTLNTEGFGKILKKYDKQLETETKEKYSKKVQLGPFFLYNELRRLLVDTEDIFSNVFCGGNRRAAMDTLRVTEAKGERWMTFRVGLFVGFAISLLVLNIIVRLCDEDRKSFFDQDSEFLIFRMVGMIILIIFMWGLAMFVWKRFRINYIFIFEFDARGHLSFQLIFEAASIFVNIWLFAILMAQYSADPPRGLSFIKEIPPKIWPLICVLLVLIVALFQQYKANWWLAESIFRIFTAPSKSIQFRDIFLGDQLVSLSIVISDIVFTVVYLICDSWNDNPSTALKANDYFRPFCMGLPSLWRFLQCLRKARDTKSKKELANALKYTGNMIVTAMSALRQVSNGFTYVWLSIALISTIYNYYWDIINDWGLMHLKTNNFLLRDVLMYEKPIYYYPIMIGDVILRFMWIFTISPAKFGVDDEVIGHELFLSIITTVEILRRGVWNIFRLEHQHVINVEQYKATKDIPMVVAIQHYQIADGGSTDLEGEEEDDDGESKASQ